MYYLSFLFLTCLVFSTCSTHKDCCIDVVAAKIELEYINDSGDDLLSRFTKNYYNENDFKIFYLVNGEKREMLRENLNHPKMFSLSSPHVERSHYLLSLYLNDLSEEEIKTTFLQLNNIDIDTIRHTQKNINNDLKIIDKVWYNGNLSKDNNTFKVEK